MLIKREVLEKIKSGEITLQFRRWRRRSVKAGGTLKTAVGVLNIGEITPIRAEDVTDADAKRAGFADVQDFLKWLDTMKPGELDRIEVSYGGEDPRIALREASELDAEAMFDLSQALDAIDMRAGTGWSLAALMLIGERSGERAEVLADEMGLEKAPFKDFVRALKDLGLTESLETGYRLSPRGAAVLELRKA